MRFQLFITCALMLSCGVNFGLVLAIRMGVLL